MVFLLTCGKSSLTHYLNYSARPCPGANFSLPARDFTLRLVEAILKHKVFLVPARAEVVLWANRISFGCSALWSLAARCPSRGQSWRFLTCAWQPPQALSHLLFSVMLVNVLGAVVLAFVRPTEDIPGFGERVLAFACSM